VADLKAWAPYGKLALLVAIPVAAALVVRASPLNDAGGTRAFVEDLERVRDSGWAPAVFVACYAASTALALPGSLLTIAGGAVFGFWWGAVLNTLGANLGANAAFLLGRALGRDGVKRLAGRRLGALDRATAEHGFTGLLVLRLIPLVPFNALNVGSGLTAVRWRDYALATTLGILPGTLVYSFFADALVQGSTSASAEARAKLWIAAGLFLLLALIPLLARRLGLVSRSS
jgi:uncharacterized membrane protein YdjX (TVP38/TMEM64 family)